MSAIWPSVPLGEVIQHRKAFITINDVEVYKRCRVQLHAQGIVVRDRVPGIEIKTKQQQVCKTGEFLVAEIDAKLGGFGIVPPELDGALVSSHYFLFTVTPERLDLRFLEFFSKTPGFQEQVAAQGSTNYAAIRPSHVLGYTIPLPPLSEQRRIVARIEELAAKIEEAQRLRREVKAEAISLFRANISQRLSYVSNVVKLGSGIATIICGQHLSPDEQVEKGNLPYITGPIDFGTRFAKPSRFARVKKSTSVWGDVLLTVKGAGVGKVNLAPHEETVIGRQLYAIRPHSQHLETTYLWYVLQDRLADLREGITATTVPGIGKEEVNSINIPLPSKNEQQSIVAEMDGLNQKADALKVLQSQSTDELAALLPSVLDKAFKGEL